MFKLSSLSKTIIVMTILKLVGLYVIYWCLFKEYKQHVNPTVVEHYLLKEIKGK